MQTGWTPTLFGIGFSIVGFALTAIALWRRPQGRTMVTLSPAALIVAIWAIVIASAHTVAAFP